MITTISTDTVEVEVDGVYTFTPKSDETRYYCLREGSMWSEGGGGNSFSIMISYELEEAEGLSDYFSDQTLIIPMEVL